MVWEIDQILGRKFRIKFFFQIFGIIRAYPEYQHASHIAEYRVAHFGGGVRHELADVLMRNDEVEAVFARLGQDACKRICGEVLELVHIHIKIPPVLLGNAHALHGSELNLGNDHGAEKRGVILADPALGYIDEEYFPLIHYLRNVERRAGLAHDIANKRCI